MTTLRLEANASGSMKSIESPALVTFPRRSRFRKRFADYVAHCKAAIIFGRSASNEQEDEVSRIELSDLIGAKWW